MKQTLLYIPNAPEELMASTREAELNLIDLLFEFNGREARASSEELPPGPVPLNERLNSIVYTHWTSTSGVTQTQRNNFQILSEEYPVLKNLVEKLNETVRNIQSELDKIGAPWTPGRTGINDAQDN